MKITLEQDDIEAALLSHVHSCLTIASGVPVSIDFKGSAATVIIGNQSIAQKPPAKNTRSSRTTKAAKEDQEDTSDSESEPEADTSEEPAKKEPEAETTSEEEAAAPETETADETDKPEAASAAKTPKVPSIFDFSKKSA